jgi:hypothetical protein
MSKSPQTKGLILRAVGNYPTGQVHETAIWVYDAAKDAFNLVLALAAGGFSEVRVINSGPLDGYLIAVSWSWDKDEVRWDDHRRMIAAYRLERSAGSVGYREVLDYVTADKYGAEDTDTIDSEWSTLLTPMGGIPK